jgi:hypothetical protein
MFRPAHLRQVDCVSVAQLVLEVGVDDLLLALLDQLDQRAQPLARTSPAWPRSRRPTIRRRDGLISTISALMAGMASCSSSALAMA